MTFAISNTKEAVQLLTLHGQRKIVHHGNNELKAKSYSETSNMQIEKLSMKENGKIKK